MRFWLTMSPRPSGAFTRRSSSMIFSLVGVTVMVILGDLAMQARLIGGCAAAHE
jgi:hypothetical protein